MSRTIGATTVDYVWDLSGGLPNVLEDSQGNRYVYGLDLIARINGSTEEYYLADGLGSTTSLTDDTGNVTVEYAYDAFGNYRPGEGSSEQRIHVHRRAGGRDRPTSAHQLNITTSNARSLLPATVDSVTSVLALSESDC